MMKYSCLGCGVWGLFFGLDFVCCSFGVVVWGVWVLWGLGFVGGVVRCVVRGGGVGGGILWFGWCLGSVFVYLACVVC